MLAGLRDALLLPEVTWNGIVAAVEGWLGAALPVSAERCWWG